MSRPDRKTIRHRGKEYPVLERIRIGDRDYFLVERIAQAGRRRYKAITPACPPDEQICIVFLFPRNQASLQHIKTLRRLSRDGGNTNLPRILSYANHGNDVAVATNWVKGVTLDEYLRNADKGVITRRSPTNIMRCYTGLALGLRQIHRHRGIIHGDIKPANLVLTSSPQRLVMIDFGSAWMKATTTYRSDGDGNSQYYAAPEQLNDSPGIYEAIDQFSASLVAYELLTGTLPYGGMGGKAGLPGNREIYEPQWEPPSRKSPHQKDVPRRIWDRMDAILGRALSLDAEDRYPTDDEWLTDLHGLRSEIDRKTQQIPAGHWVLRCGRWFSRVLTSND